VKGLAVGTPEETGRSDFDFCPYLAVACSPTYPPQQVNVASTSQAVTLTILSNLAASPTVTSVVSLTGTGNNSIPSPFSFTPLVNVWNVK
jgi:hypothetical protein